MARGRHRRHRPVGRICRGRRPPPPISPAQTARVLHERILEKKLETIYSEVELPLAPLLYRMERAGLKVDRKVLSDLSNFLGQELARLTEQIYKARRS